jgi:hypothetical protein
MEGEIDGHGLGVAIGCAHKRVGRYVDPAKQHRSRNNASWTLRVCTATTPDDTSGVRRLFHTQMEAFDIGEAACHMRAWRPTTIAS